MQEKLLVKRYVFALLCVWVLLCVWGIPFASAVPFMSAMGQFNVSPAPICVQVCYTVTPLATRTTVPLNPLFQTATAIKVASTPTPESLPFPSPQVTVQGSLPLFTVKSPNGLYTYTCPSTFNGACVRRNAVPAGTVLSILTSDYIFCVNDGTYYRLKTRDSAGNTIWVAWKHISNPTIVFGTVDNPQIQTYCDHKGG